MIHGTDVRKGVIAHPPNFNNLHSYLTSEKLAFYQDSWEGLAELGQGPPQSSSSVMFGVGPAVFNKFPGGNDVSGMGTGLKKWLV